MNTPDTAYQSVYLTPQHYDDDGGYSIETADGRRVAFVWPYQTEIRLKDGGTMPIVPFGSHDPEGDARRFAASADLLAACEAAVSFLERQGYDHRHCDTHGYNIRRKLEAAIVKARP